MCFIPNLLSWSRINLFHFSSSRKPLEKKVDFSLQTRGPNWYFRCLDLPERQRGRRNRGEIRKRLKRKKENEGHKKNSITFKKVFVTFFDVFVDEFFPGYKLENEGRYSWAILLKFSIRVGGGEGSNFVRAVSTATSVRQVMREKETYDL